MGKKKEMPNWFKERIDELFKKWRKIQKTKNKESKVVQMEVYLRSFEEEILKCDEKEKGLWVKYFEGMEMFLDIFYETEEQLRVSGIEKSHKNMCEALEDKILGIDVKKLKLIKE